MGELRHVVVLLRAKPLKAFLQTSLFGIKRRKAGIGLGILVAQGKIAGKIVEHVRLVGGILEFKRPVLGMYVKKT